MTPEQLRIAQLELDVAQLRLERDRARASLADLQKAIRRAWGQSRGEIAPTAERRSRRGPKEPLDNRSAP